MHRDEEGCSCFPWANRLGLGHKCLDVLLEGPEEVATSASAPWPPGDYAGRDGSNFLKISNLTPTGSLSMTPRNTPLLSILLELLEVNTDCTRAEL